MSEKCEKCKKCQKKSEEKKNEIKDKIKVVSIPSKVEFKKYDVPDALKIWDSPESMSPEYKEMMDEISSICDYIVKQLNEGPEVSESISKRALTLKAIIKLIMMKTFLNHFYRLGILEQLLYETLYEQQVRQVMSAVQEQMQEQAEKQEKKMSYVQ
jgi:hypothetical protein